MHENDYSQQQEQELRIKNKVQADFEDEMHEMLMDLRFFYLLDAPRDGTYQPGKVLDAD